MRTPCFQAFLPTVLAFFLACPSLAPASKPKSAQAERSQLPEPVAQAFKQANIPLSAVSIVVAPLSNASPNAALPKPRLSLHANAEMNPASVMKLITTSAGLSLLGPDFTWRNKVFIDGSVKEGVLQGNLYLKGSGDPKLVVERLQALLQDLMAKGIRDVKGDIVLDSSVFDLPAKNPASFDDEPLRPYNVAPQGLLLNFNAMLFKFTPNATAVKPKWKASRHWPMCSGPAACPCRRVHAKIGAPNFAPIFPKSTACASMALTPEHVESKSGPWRTSSRKALPLAWCKPCGVKRVDCSRVRFGMAVPLQMLCCGMKRSRCP
jgi:hypothetical protein